MSELRTFLAVCAEGLVMLRIVAACKGAAPVKSCLPYALSRKGRKPEESKNPLHPKSTLKS